MHSTTYPYSPSDAPWFSGAPRLQLADPSVAPASEPSLRALQEPGAAVTVAEGALYAKSDPLRDARNEWVESLRTSVRGTPPVSVAAAFALGPLVALMPG